MSFSADEEILQDFLVEAGEILEQLSSQLVDLEHNSEDLNLLNAIFRGFHTVKGGAGFLQLEPLVELCHISENVFDDLRNEKLSVTPELMDVVLQALDAINNMFQSISARQDLNPASRDLIASLKALVEEPASRALADQALLENPVKSTSDNKTSDNKIENPSKSMPENTSSNVFEDLFESTSDNAFEQASESEKHEEITEEEFEALLNELQKDNPEKKPAQMKSPQESETKLTEIVNSEKEDISDDEFEALLDTLHGKGKHNATLKEAPDLKKPGSEIPVSEPLPKPSSPNKKEVKPTPVTDSAAVTETTVRVDTKRLDDIVNMVGELVLVRNRLVRLGIKTVDEAMSKAVANLDVVTTDLQSVVMKTRMQPIKKVFGRFPRVVRDLARSLRKEVNLELKGEDTDLDKNLVEALADPLVHLVRNAVDHGIESPENRVNAGKPKAGRIVLSAQQEGDHIVLSISDDGAGMDPQVLRRKAVEKGLMDSDIAERLSDQDSFNLIFHPGFSTKTEISDVSGRGVGMDVVKTKINQLNGSINVQSVKGQGSVIAIQVPLTLAIMPTLMVMLGQQVFALPLVNVNEIFHLDLSKTNEVDGQEVIIVRGKALPIFHLKQWLVKVTGSNTFDSGHVVVVTVGTEKVGFVVDQLIGQEEVVIKPLGKMIHGTAGMAGATITGDGGIALILDIPGILKRYAGRFR